MGSFIGGVQCCTKMEESVEMGNTRLREAIYLLGSDVHFLSSHGQSGTPLCDLTPRGTV